MNEHAKDTGMDWIYDPGRGWVFEAESPFPDGDFYEGDLEDALDEMGFEEPASMGARYFKWRTWAHPEGIDLKVKSENGWAQRNFGYFVMVLYGQNWQGVWVSSFPDLLSLSRELAPLVDVAAKTRIYEESIGLEPQP